VPEQQATTSQSLTVAARTENLARVRCFVRAAAAELGANPDAVDDLVLAVDEVVTNVIMHGYQNREGTVDVEIERKGDDAIVRVRDQAPPFDPTRVPEPDLNVPLEERPVGGLGVFLIRQMVDEMRYRAGIQGGNELTLIKHMGYEGNR